MKIEGIKSHKKTEFSVENYNTLVGENNSGKSNILFAIRWFFNDLKIQKSDVTNDYSDLPSVKIVFAFEDDEDIPSLFEEGYKLEDNKFEIEAYLKEMTGGSQSPKHQLIKEGKQPKSITSKKVQDLIDLIFIPSVRTLKDEFKFTANSSINQLVSKYITDKIKEEDKYSTVEEAVNKLSSSMDKGDSSPFKQLQSSLKSYMLDYKNAEIVFNLEPPKVEDFIKGCFETKVKVGNEKLSPESQGMGFQRSLIFSLLCNIADIDSDSSKLSLYLIEEPELFLHPNHQNHFRNKLLDLSAKENNQILLTSHSPYFLNNIEKKKYSQVKRVYMDETGVSILKEISEDDISDICQKNGFLMAEAKDICRETRWTPLELKEKSDKIAEEDELRYLLWIDPNRANAFLSKKVILVEGSTEKAFFSFLFYHDKGAFCNEKRTSEIAVIDVVGKYHFFKFANLLHKLGIPTWILYDTDEDKEPKNQISHKKLNSYIKQMKIDGVIVDCLQSHPFLEKALGFDKGKKIPDVAIYQNLIDNDSNCRDSTHYSDIVTFVRNIINY